MVLHITQGMEGIQMIIETLLILVSLGILYIVWHSLYTHYKEKEWRRNNPEEHDIMNRPVKKDPGLE
jgi:hypothetical protein